MGVLVVLFASVLLAAECAGSTEPVIETSGGFFFHDEIFFEGSLFGPYG
jgi:hypothetical protein